jgi:hypothetical protein
MFLRFLEVGTILFIIWFLITQVIIPGIRGTKSFPLFQREAKLKKDLEEVNQKVVEKAIEKTIETIKQKEGV